jgi:hypothetical protein
MRRKSRKPSNRTILIVILSALLIMLMMVYHIGEQSRITELLIKRHQQQSNKISQLENDIKDLKVSNKRLEEVVVYQHSIIKELEAKPTKTEYITISPKVSDKPEYNDKKNDIQDDIDELSKPSITTVIVGTLATLGAGYKVARILPIIP